MGSTYIPNKQEAKMAMKKFIKEFQEHYLLKLNQAHLNIMLLVKQRVFVGSKTLSISLKFIAQSLNYQKTRMMTKPHIESILMDISLPLFICSEKDKKSFAEDPIEYVRLQVDSSGEHNVKVQLSHLFERICNFKFGKRSDKQPPVHLMQYINIINENLGNVRGQDLFTEALFYAFGSLDEKYELNMNKDLNLMV